MRIGLYPGTFDPITKGHEDLIQRASQLCDQLYIGVAYAHHKHTLFSAEERGAMVENVLQDLTLHCPTKVIRYDGLLVQLCQQQQVNFILRGLRSYTDLAYEQPLAMMNRHLDEKIETIFLLSNPTLAFISSTLVREVAKLKGNLQGLVSPIIAHQLNLKFAEK